MARIGKTTGQSALFAMIVFLKLTKPRRRRIEVEFDLLALQTITEFLRVFSSREGWDTTNGRPPLRAQREEALLMLLRQDEAGEEPEVRRLLLLACREDGGAVLEFVASTGAENLQDRLVLLGERAAADEIEREVSLRLLRHLASSVRYQQYHDADIVTVRVDALKPTAGGGT